MKFVFAKQPRLTGELAKKRANNKVGGKFLIKFYFMLEKIQRGKMSWLAPSGKIIELFTFK